MTDSGIWTPGPVGDPAKNAFRHWGDHGKQFPEYLNAVQYVRGAHAFLSTLPAGTQSKVRSNGDVLLYHGPSNTFAIKTAGGVPRTMFKPTDAQAYFNRQH